MAPRVARHSSARTTRTVAYLSLARSANSKERKDIGLMPRTYLSRRGFIAGIGVGLAGVALAACGGGQAPAAQPTTAPPQSQAPTQAAAPTATSAPAAAAGSAATPTAAPASQAAPSGGKTVSGEVTWLVRTTVEENNGQAQVFEPLIKQQLPNVKINRVIIPQDQYIPKINSMAAANDSL